MENQQQPLLNIERSSLINHSTNDASMHMQKRPYNKVIIAAIIGTFIVVVIIIVVMSNNSDPDSPVLPSVQPAAAAAAPSTPYDSLGCYTDTNTIRALRDMAPTEDHTIETCSKYATLNNSKIFGMQHGNQCWIDSDPSRDYKMHGSATCTTRDAFPIGSGDAWLNEIYRIN
jgi:hypothetical protein